MDTLELSQSVSQEIAADIRNMPDELAKILDAEADSAHPMTNILDMLAGIAESRSQMEGDRWEQIAQAVQKCATFCEHETKEPSKPYRPISDAVERMDNRERVKEFRRG